MAHATARRGKALNLRKTAVDRILAESKFESAIRAAVGRILRMDSDIRWKQRFQNFDKAFLLLRDALKDGPSKLSLLEKEGVIQRFEYSFELAWKTVKDFLEDGGLKIEPVTPRQVIKEAFAAGVILDGQVWIDMMDHRNVLSHKNDSLTFEKAVDAISNRYLPAMEKLHEYLARKSAS